MARLGRPSQKTSNDSAVVSDGKSNDEDHTNPAESEIVLPRRPHSVEIEKRVLRKIDKRLIPLLTTLYVLSSLDRSNIGNAKVAGMNSSLKMSSADYNWLLSIFYIAYIVFEWFALMWKVVPPHMWAALCVTLWGIIATLQGATHSFKGMMASRFFLGFAEAGFGPGVPYLLSFFYLRRELGFRIGIFLSGAPLATCFAGALAYGITSGHPKGIESWRLLFIVEGIPCVLVGIATFFWLPDSPEKCNFLTLEEKEVARARGVQQVGSEAAHRVGRIRWAEIGAALLDVKNWLTALMYFSCNVSFSSLPVFLPTILLEFGPQFTDVTAQGLSAPPYFIAFLFTILSSYIADRTAQRGIMIMAISLIGATGYILLATTTALAPRYAGVFLAAMGVFPAIANILPWVLNNQGSDTKRGSGIAILNLVGQCGPLLGTRLYPVAERPYYKKGMWVCAAFMLFNGMLAFALRMLLVWENSRLDKKYGVIRGSEKLESDKEEEIPQGIENDGPQFRYIL